MSSVFGFLRGWAGPMCAAVLWAAVPSAQAQEPGDRSAWLDPECDRACLLDFVDQYMEGLARKDTSRVAFSDDVKFSENSVMLQIGDGLWGSVSGVHEGAMTAADTETGNAAWFGIVEELGEPAYFAVRLKVEDMEITEVETVVTRNTGMPMPFGDPETVTHDPAFNEVIPPDERVTRERLIRIAYGYFSTVELNDGTIFTPFHEDCERLENGVSTTAGAGSGTVGSEGCEEQLKLGIYRINLRIRERRFPLVDEERGVVIASGFFDHANGFSRYTLNDGREMETFLKWPNSLTLLEAFKVKDGKLHRIEAVFTYVPYFTHSPWFREGDDQ